MGTHPIFESDFDCLTELKDVSNLFKNFAINDVIDGKCSKCVGEFKHPVELPCRHVLCFSCVVDCCKKAFAENIECPSCKSKVNFPLGSIKNLPTVCPIFTREEIDSILMTNKLSTRISLKLAERGET